MIRLVISSMFILSLAMGGRADAQQGASSEVQAAPAQPTQVITTLPNASLGVQGYPSSTPGSLHYELEEANEGIRATRNALIATSALATVGMIVGATAFAHCEVIYYNSSSQPDDLVCTQRGNALLAAGGTIFGLAAIGMITSGVMLGVRKGKRRRLNRDIRAREGAHLQWNVETARLEF